MRWRALLIVLAPGCAPAAPKVAWIVEFESAADREATRIVHAALHRNPDCTGAETWATDVDRGEQPSVAPGRIGRGAWGLSAVALDADCNVVASGCVAIEVPTRASITIVMRPDARPCEGAECAACPGESDAGEDALSDHGHLGGPVLSARRARTRWRWPARRRDRRR